MESCFQDGSCSVRFLLHKKVRKRYKEGEEKAKPVQESGAPCRVGKWWKSLKNTDVWCSVLRWLCGLKLSPSISLKFSLKSAGHIGFRDLSSTLDTTKPEEVLNSTTGLIWAENGQQEWKMRQSQTNMVQRHGARWPQGPKSPSNFQESVRRALTLCHPPNGEGIRTQ